MNLAALIIAIVALMLAGAQLGVHIYHWRMRRKTLRAIDFAITKHTTKSLFTRDVQ